MASKNDIYVERNRLVALISKIFPSYIGVDEKIEEGVCDHVVYVELPTGQCSWHVPSYLLHLFEHLETREDAEWDGHTTKEKYSRVKRFKPKMLEHLLTSNAELV